MNTYTLMFTDVTNSLEEQAAPAFNESRMISDELVSLIIRNDNNIIPGRQYNVTIFAINSAGSRIYASSFCELHVL